MKFLWTLPFFLLIAPQKLVSQDLTPTLQLSENQRYLITEDGKPFFWLGDTGWLLLSKLDREEASIYLEDRAEKGFNVIQVMLLHTLNVTNVYGDSALIGGDISKPCIQSSYDFWDHVDYITDLAEQNGIYVAMVPVWGSNIRKGGTSSVQAATYANWLAERFADRPNIIWLNGGDTRGDQNTEIWNAIGQQLHENAPEHLITFHPFGRCKSSTWFHATDWLDFNMFQSGHRRYDQDDSELGYGQDNWKYVRDDYALKPVKPTLDGEPSYEGIPQGLHDPAEPYWNDNDVRRYAYWSVFAGACGFTYGHGAVMQMHRPSDLESSYGVHEYWTDALNSKGAQQMKYLKNLILARPYFERIPDQSLIASASEEQYNFQVGTRGKEYALIYTFNGREILAQMGIIEGTKILASWYNPRNGKSTPIGEYENTGINSFAPPGDKKNGMDWVLVLESNQK